MGRRFAFLILAAALMPQPAPAASMDDTEALRISQAALGRALGDAAFRDTGGRTVRLAELKGRPLVLNFVYSACAQSCGVMTSFLADTLDNARDVLGDGSFTAVTVGFAGILVMLRPGTGAFQMLGLIPLAAAVTSSFRDLYARRLTRTETHDSMMFWSTLATTVLTGASLLFGWVAIPLADLALLATSGAFIAIAHYMMIESYRVAEAAIVAPFKYAAILWAVLFGYAIWGHVPDLYIVVGGAIVIASGLYILHRETRRG